MNCKNCNYELPQNAKFCGKCGTKVENVSEEITVDESERQLPVETDTIDPILEENQESVAEPIAQDDAGIQKNNKNLNFKVIIPLVIIAVLFGGAFYLYNNDILRLNGSFPFVDFYKEGSMALVKNQHQVKRFYEIKIKNMVDALEKKNNEFIINEYRDIFAMNKMISEEFKEPKNEKEQQLAKEFQNQMQVLNQTVEKYRVDIISAFVGSNDVDKQFLGEVFQIDMITGENGIKLVEIMSNFYAQNNDVEKLNQVLRTAISVYGSKGLELVNSLQEKLYTQYPNLPKAWSYLDTPSYDIVMNAEDGYFKVANKIQGQTLWGLVDSTGKEMIAPQYELIGNFLEDRAAVKKNGKWGFIDKTGSVVINFQFDDLKYPNDLSFYQHAIRNPENVSRGFYNGFAGVSIGNKWGFIDRNGRALGPGIVFKEVQNFSEGSAPVTMDGENYGLLSSTGSYIIAPNQFSYTNGITFGVIRPIFEGLAGVNWDNYNERGLINKYGELVHVFDRSQKVTLVQDFREGLSSFRQKDYNGKNHWGFIDRSGRIVIPAVYDSVSIFIDGISIVQKNGQYGLINREGREVLPISYDKITRSKNGLVKVFKNAKMALANSRGDVITDFKYSDIGLFKQGMSYYIQDGKYGLINSEGKEVLPPAYRTISTFNNGLAPALRQDNWGYIDSSGFFVIEPVFEKIIAFDNGISAVKKDGKFRFIKINSVSSSVVGQVIAENGDPIANAQVFIYKSGNSKIYASAKTNADGQYQIMLPESDYRFVVDKEGYLSSSIYTDLTGEENYNIERVILISNDSGSENKKSEVKIKTGESLTGQGLSNVKIKFRNGFNNKKGSYIKDAAGSDIVVSTDSSGYFTITLPIGLYTAETNIEGYSNTYINFAVSPKIDYQSLDRNIPITKKLDTNQIRITLEWGSFPNDLDSHLFGNLSDGYSPFHVYYPYKENSEGSAKLDKDDTQGNGFETTTIYNLNGGTYYYDVFDFSNQSDYYSSIMSNSGAKVKVWRGSETIAVFDVPTNRVGNIWRVFQIRDNKIIPINVIENSYNVDDYIY